MAIILIVATPITMVLKLSVMLVIMTVCLLSILAVLKLLVTRYGSLVKSVHKEGTIYY